MPFSLSPRERAGVRGNRPPDFSGAWLLALSDAREPPSRSGRSSAVSPSLAFNASSVSVTVESKAIPPMARNVNLIPCRAIASWSAAVLLPLSRTDEISQPMPFSLSPRERVGVRGNRPPDHNLAHINFPSPGEVGFGAWNSSLSPRERVGVRGNQSPDHKLAHNKLSGPGEAGSEAWNSSLSPRERVGVRGNRPPDHNLAYLTFPGYDEVGSGAWNFSLSPRERVGVRGNRPPDHNLAHINFPS